MTKTRKIEINLTEFRGGFSIFKKPESVSSYNFSNLSSLRHLLSNEKAKILHCIKNQKPISIYDLAKKLKRGFKSVNDDVKLLEKFGFIKLLEEKTKNRKRYMPELNADEIVITLRV